MQHRVAASPCHPLPPLPATHSATLSSVRVNGATGGLTLLCHRAKRGWQQRVRPPVARRCTKHLNCTEATHRHPAVATCRLLSVATGGQTLCCQPSKLGGTSGQTPTATLPSLPTASFPSLQGVRPAARHTFRHPELRSRERCDRGSDPPVPPSEARLATEGLTQCRATMHETPELHRGDPTATLPSLPAASFPSIQGVRPAVASRVNSVAHRVRPPQPPYRRYLPPTFRRFRGSDPLLPQIQPP